MHDASTATLLWTCLTNSTYSRMNLVKESNCTHFNRPTAEIGRGRGDPHAFPTPSRAIIPKPTSRMTVARISTGTMPIRSLRVVPSNGARNVAM